MLQPLDTKVIINEYGNISSDDNSSDDEALAEMSSQHQIQEPHLKEHQQILQLPQIQLPGNPVWRKELKLGQKPNKEELKITKGVQFAPTPPPISKMTDTLEGITPTSAHTTASKKLTPRDDDKMQDLGQCGDALPETSADPARSLFSNSQPDMCREYDRLKTFELWPVSFMRPQDLAKSGFYYLGRGDEVRCAFCKVELMRWEEGDDPEVDHKRWSPLCVRSRSNIPILSDSGKYECEVKASPETSADPPRSLFSNSQPDMCREYDRLKTFELWPVSFMRPQDLAKSGFYYLGRGDEVRCAFCKVEIMRWEEGDDPEVDHKRWSPHCGVVRSRSNMPISTDSGKDECQVPASPFSDNKIWKPVHPRYASELERLRSFGDWPKSLDHMKKDLVEAGFFYTGKGDMIKCFSCDGGLKDWEHDNEPWTEHARWYDHCDFVKQMKGHDFIKNAKSEQIHNGVKVPPEPDVTSFIENQIPSVEDYRLCKICFVEERNVCFIPCSHVVACAKCALASDKCPLCRMTFTNVLQLHFT